MKLSRQCAFKVGAIPVWLFRKQLLFGAAGFQISPLWPHFLQCAFSDWISAKDIFAYLPANCYHDALPMKAHMIAFIPLPWAISFSDSCARVSFWKAVYVFHRHPMRDIFRSSGGLFLGHFPGRILWKLTSHGSRRV